MARGRDFWVPYRRFLSGVGEAKIREVIKKFEEELILIDGLGDRTFWCEMR